MNLLLDSHAVIWFLLTSRRLSATARRAIENPRNIVFVSAVAGYEIGLKAARGEIDERIAIELASAVAAARFAELPITLAHASRAAELGGLHKDPWDRLLLAQTKTEGLVLVSIDPFFDEYGVRRLW